MKHLRLLFAIFLVLLPTLVLGADTQYGYPVRGSYEATILGTPDSMKPDLPKKVRMKKLVLDVIPEREKPPVFFYDAGLNCTFAYQKKKAPLIFLIAAYGASNLSESQAVLMKSFYQAGFHVITLPSTTNPNFILSASRSCVPGYLKEDAEDLYRAMAVAWHRVGDRIEVSDFYLLGSSLGGTQAAFVAKLDEEQKVFNFRKVLMINPPVSLLSSVVKIEGLLRDIPEGPNREGAFFNRMLSKFTDFYHYGNFVAINEDFLYAVYREHLFTNQEAGGLIGLSYRINLAGVIFTSDVMTNSGYVVPKNRVLKNSDPLDDYFQVASHLSFLNYFEEYLLPYFQRRDPSLTKESFAASLSLRSIDGYLRSSSKFGVILNENDFILSPEELQYLKDLFGERAKVYPWGGHLGNLSYKDNVAYTVGFFK